LTEEVEHLEGWRLLEGQGSGEDVPDRGFQLGNGLGLWNGRWKQMEFVESGHRGRDSSGHSEGYTA
jgi:hypothetical protein